MFLIKQVQKRGEKKKTVMREHSTLGKKQLKDLKKQLVTLKANLSRGVEMHVHQSASKRTWITENRAE